MQMFQKGSPLARDVSKAILNLSEKAELKRLEEKWLITSQDCSNNMTSSDDNTDSLKLRSLWVLFVISAATSTICLLLSTPRMYSRKLNNSREAQDVTDCSSRADHESIADTPEHQQEMASLVPKILMLPSPPEEVQMTTRDGRPSESHRLQNASHIRHFSHPY